MSRLATTSACPASASRCPNAQACSVWDQYGPDCEQGVVMQKCFVAIHREFGVLSFLTKAAAGSERLERANRHLHQSLHSVARRTGS
jgi:hypothetical protein